MQVHHSRLSGARLQLHQVPTVVKQLQLFQVYDQYLLHEQQPIFMIYLLRLRAGLLLNIGTVKYYWLVNRHCSLVHCNYLLMMMCLCQYFRFGTQDPDLRRPYDMSARIRMSSVYYIHTQRFVQELLLFMQHFNYLQDALGRIRAAAVGRKVSYSHGYSVCCVFNVLQPNL